MKFVLGIALALGVAAAAYGAAETLTVTSGALQSGSDTDLSCDSDGVKVNFSGFPPNWNTADLDDVNDNCDGEEIIVEVLDGSGGVLASGSGTVPTVTGDDDFQISLSNPLEPSEVGAAESVRVTIVS